MCAGEPAVIDHRHGDIVQAGGDEGMIKREGFVWIQGQDLHGGAIAIVDGTRPGIAAGVREGTSADIGGTLGDSTIDAE